MKTKEKQQTNESVVAQLRSIRDKMSLEIMDLNADQLKAYFQKQQTLHPGSYWKK